MPSGTSRTWPSRESNLPHQAHEVVEEPLLRDLPLLVPCGHRAELHPETLPGRRDDLPLRGLHRSLHRAGEFRDGARVVAICDENLVRAVDEVVVRERLEEFNGFHVMVVPSPRGRRAAGPVHGDIFGVTLPKSLPKRTFRSGVPSIVQRRHQVDQLLLLHRRPLPPHRRVRSRNLAMPFHRLTHPLSGCVRLALAHNQMPVRCVGQDSNLGTPSGRDLESLAFDRAWLPTRDPRDAGARKTFPVGIDAATNRQSLFPTSPTSRGREGLMVQYFSETFFDELASRLNAEPECAKRATTVTAKIVLTYIGRNASFLLDIVGGKVAASAVPPDVLADFKFEGPYDAWMQLGKGERDFQGLVLGGKIRFRGSMPKIMALTGQLNRITQVAQQVPKEF